MHFTQYILLVVSTFTACRSNPIPQEDGALEAAGTDDIVERDPSAIHVKFKPAPSEGHHYALYKNSINEVSSIDSDADAAAGAAEFVRRSGSRIMSRQTSDSHKRKAKKPGPGKPYTTHPSRAKNCNSHQRNCGPYTYYNPKILEIEKPGLDEVGKSADLLDEMKRTIVRPLKALVLGADAENQYDQQVDELDTVSDASIVTAQEIEEFDRTDAKAHAGLKLRKRDVSSEMHKKRKKKSKHHSNDNPSPSPKPSSSCNNNTMNCGPYMYYRKPIWEVDISKLEGQELEDHLQALEDAKIAEADRESFLEAFKRTVAKRFQLSKKRDPALDPAEGPSNEHAEAAVEKDKRNQPYMYNHPQIHEVDAKEADAQAEVEVDKDKRDFPYMYNHPQIHEVDAEEADLQTEADAEAR